MTWHPRGTWMSVIQRWIIAGLFFVLAYALFKVFGQ